MAKYFQSKTKKRTLTALSLALAATLSLGALAACAEVSDDQTDDNETNAAPTDTQLIKNGNFEFYADQQVDEIEKRLGVINTADSWTQTTGSPSSDTKSGIVNTADWANFARSGGYPFTTYTKGDEEVTTFSSIADAYAHWEDDNVNAYDRIKFLDIYEDEIDDLSSTSEEKKLFNKYSYSVDFEDIEKLDEDFGGGLSLHDGVKENESSVLMIHNSKTSDGVRGTAQYYTSSTTVTLSAGTAAKISVWVRTDKLVHYENTDLKARGGAYIGVTNTVGGTSLDQMQIYNINTDGAWKQYTVYVRASTFATTTFRIVLGLGQGSSDDRYYAVDGYAFFDDLTCELMAGSRYETETADGSIGKCTVDSLKEEKQFDADSFKGDTFALDLYAGFEAKDALLDDAKIGLTEEISGSNVYTSGKIDSKLGDSENNYAKVASLSDIAAEQNADLKRVYENDIKGKYPFGGSDSPIVMLMSGNGAAYTATLTAPEFTLAPDSRLLISFFVKTSAIRSGLSGASAAIVDGENKTLISAFDSTTVATVDIDSKSDDESLKDIYKGWVQCFFFLENSTDNDKTFSLQLSYGPTTIVGTTAASYGDGYAAFTNFEIKDLSKTEYSYASTGDRAKKVSLTGEVEETKKFDSVSATEEKTLESAPALPANFRGVLGGSNFVTEGGSENKKPENVDAGLINAKYAQNYFESGAEWKTALDFAAGGAENGESWWTNLFGNARQPLVIVNREAAAYGFFAETATVSASAYQRISMRVKAPTGAKAYIYLTDVSSAEKSGQLIYPELPLVTYWYDDEGNICTKDPASEDYNEKTDIAYDIQENGLYLKAGETSGTYYANLYNYDKDDEGNLVTKDGTIAFYEDGGVYYAYFDEESGVYSQPVSNLPADIARYDMRNVTLPGTQIIVEGNGEWQTVNFYLHTGNEAKSYRLEVWSGSRDGAVKNPAGSYVFFDNYASASYSNYESLLSETVQAIKDQLNEGKDINDENSGYLGADDNLSEEYARYYTFTFYDAKTYTRYDVNEDPESLGNPYGSYTQSSNSEQLVYLYYKDEGEDSAVNYSYFLDYSSIDVTVEQDDLTPDDSDDSDDTDTEATPTDTNIWLFASSIALVAALAFVIVVLIVRALVKKFGKHARIKPAKDKRVRPAKTKDQNE